MRLWIYFNIRSPFDVLVKITVVKDAKCSVPFFTPTLCLSLSYGCSEFLGDKDLLSNQCCICKGKVVR